VYFHIEFGCDPLMSLRVSRTCGIPHPEGLVPTIIPNGILTFHYMAHYLVDVLIPFQGFLQLLGFIGKSAIV